MDLSRFLGSTIYGNSVRAWLTMLLLLVIGVSLLIAIKKIVVRRSTSGAQDAQPDLDSLVIDLLRRTRFFFFVFIMMAGATRTLNLSPSDRDLIYNVALVSLAVQAALWGNGLVAFWVNRYTSRRAAIDASLLMTIGALGFAARVVIWSVVLLLALDNLGIDVTTLIAGLGIGGIAVALAVQNILGDLFGALSIVVDKPFVVGDFIVVDQYMGSVEHVGLKTTRLRSLSGEQIVFSNADLLKSRIRNFQRMVERRVDFVLGVDYGTSPDKLAAIPTWIREIIEAQSQTRFDRSHFRSYGQSSLDVESVYFMTTSDYNVFMDTQQAINLAILRRLRAEGVEFAYSPRTVMVTERRAEEAIAGT